MANSGILEYFEAFLKQRVDGDPTFGPCFNLQTLESVLLDSQEKPSVLFDLSEPTILPRERYSDEIRRLAGYSSDSETISIYFEHNSDMIQRPRLRPRIRLSKLYLRDICQCSRCVCPSTGRKAFATSDIPRAPLVLDPETENIRLSADGGLEITWQDDFLTCDNHTSVYPKRFLNCLVQGNGRETFPARHTVEEWDAATFKQGIGSRKVAFHDWMEGGAEFAQAVLNLHEYGLIIMQGVPRSERCVQMIAEKIGHLQSTPRGLTWDVIARPGEGSTGCADERLHQDMLYLYEQPKVQFLHCLENESLGSVSLFSDGFHSARALHKKDFRAFWALTAKTVNYKYREAGQYLSSHRHVIRTRQRDSPISIAWSPAFQGPFSLNQQPKPFRCGLPADETLMDWRRAARAFRDEVESAENVVEYRLRPGDCVIFDNRRILHGSKQLAFPAGRKHFRGAFIDAQTLKSAFVGLVEKGLLRRRLSDGRVVGPSSSDDLNSVHENHAQFS